MYPLWCIFGPGIRPKGLVMIYILFPGSNIIRLTSRQNASHILLEFLLPLFDLLTRSHLSETLLAEQAEIPRNNKQSLCLH